MFLDIDVLILLYICLIFLLSEGHRWVAMFFYNLILFYRDFSKLQDAFYRFKKFELFFEI